MGCSQKTFKLVWRCHQLLSGFLAKSLMPRVLRQSRRSLMIRVIIKWSWGLCTDLLAFTLQLRKPSARRQSDEGAVRPVIASNGVPFLQMRSVRSHSTKTTTFYVMLVCLSALIRYFLVFSFSHVYYYSMIATLSLSVVLDFEKKNIDWTEKMNMGADKIAKSQLSSDMSPAITRGADDCDIVMLARLYWN